MHHRDSNAAHTPPDGAPPVVGRRAYRVDGDDGGWTEERVAAEFPLTLVVNDKELATVVCTPADLEDLVLGFLTAEGVLRPGERITRFFVDRERGLALVRAPERAEAVEAEAFGKRYVGSCCGKSRTGFYFVNDARTARPVDSDLRLGVGECRALMAELQTASPLFAETGGVHHAGLAGPGGLEAVRADIGRHNTLDKLYGHALRTGLALRDRAVVFSGRISSEVLLKVAKMGCPVLLSNAAPTALALELAEDLGVTSVGFLRGERMTVYTHPERIRNLPGGSGTCPGGREAHQAREAGSPG